MTTNIYKCYLFDFDGTLVDSMPYYARAMLQILDEYVSPTRLTS